MKKQLILMLLLGAMPFSMMAQDDDLYFVPSKKENKMVEKKTSYNDRPVYYVGSNRDVDEYNRRGRFRSSYQKIGTDSLGNDIIEFQPGEGVYPDTTYVDTMWVSPRMNDFNTGEDEYVYSRRMSRWDGWYGWYDPFYYRHWGYMGYGYYGWYDPWLYDAWWYGWYDPWYSPWYGYGWYGYAYGWPYYRWYDYYYHPYYYGGSYLAYTIGGVGSGAGSRNHGIPSYGASRGSFNGSSHTYANGTFGGSRAGSFGGTRTSTASSNNSGTRISTRGNTRVYTNSNGNFGGSSVNSRTVSTPTPSPSYSPAPSSSSSPSYSGGGGGGGSFGGSRSGGGGGGGGRSGGGGFGGRR